MSFNRKNPRSLVSAALLVAPLFMAGCGTDDDTFVQESKTTPVVAQAPPAPEPAPTPPSPQPVVEATYENAEQAFLEARYPQAVDLFARYTEREPNNPWGHYMLGLSAWKDGRLDVAETAFNHSLTLDPNHLKSCINLSRVLLDSKRASGALAVLDRALGIDSTSSTAHRLKGRAHHDMNQLDDAIAEYRQAILLDPTDAWAMNNLAFVWIQQGRFDDALPALARAVELRKDVAVFYNNLGMALEHAGHFVDASEAYEFAVNLDPSNDHALRNHGRMASVREDEYTVAVDLSALARRFESSIESWKVATTEARPDSVVSVQPR
jgi:Flp pilus assembly protein TadD